MVRMLAVDEVGLVMKVLRWSSALGLARKKKVVVTLDRGSARRVLKSESKGYLPPHQVDTAI